MGRRPGRPRAIWARPPLAGAQAEGFAAAISGWDNARSYLMATSNSAMESLEVVRMFT